MEFIKTTANNLESRFDDGENILDYFDAGKATQWGGPRRGAGRKKGERKQYVTRLTPETIQAIKARAQLENRPECEVLESLLAPALK